MIEMVHGDCPRALGIENHLNVQFGEDARRTRRDHSGENLALIL